VQCEANARVGEIPDVGTLQLVEDNEAIGRVIEHEAFFVFSLWLPVLEGVVVPLVLALVLVLHHRFR